MEEQKKTNEKITLKMCKTWAWNQSQNRRQYIITI